MVHREVALEEILDYAHTFLFLGVFAYSLAYSLAYSQARPSFSLR